MIDFSLIIWYNNRVIRNDLSCRKGTNMTDTSNITPPKSDFDRYKQRNEHSIKIKEITNGYLVSTLDEPPSAYPELGQICKPINVTPMTVGEHIYVFFLGEY